MAYRGNISIAQDPRFHKSSFRKELESEFPQLKELSFRVAHLAKEPVVERFVSKQITLVLEREDEVLTELVLESLRTNEKFEPYQVIETLEPFIGKPKALEVTKTIGDFLKNDPLVSESKASRLKAPNDNAKFNGGVTTEVERPQSLSATNVVPSRGRERRRSPEKRHRRRDYDRRDRYGDSRHRRDKETGSSSASNKDEGRDRRKQDASDSDSTQTSRSHRERRYRRRTSRSRENIDSRRSRDHRRRTRHRSSSADSSSSSSSSSSSGYSSKSSSSSASSDKYGRQRQKRRDRRRSPS